MELLEKTQSGHNSSGEKLEDIFIALNGENGWPSRLWGEGVVVEVASEIFKLITGTTFCANPEHILCVSEAITRLIDCQNLL